MAQLTSCGDRELRIGGLLRAAPFALPACAAQRPAAGRTSATRSSPRPGTGPRAPGPAPGARATRQPSHLARPSSPGAARAPFDGSASACAN
jgi:hypothetical protein